MDINEITTKFAGEFATLSGSTNNWTIQERIVLSAYHAERAYAEMTGDQPGTLITCWENLGEGMWGEYDPDNPEDIELLRFSLSFVPDAHADDPMFSISDVIQDSSYCTNTPVETDDKIQVRLLASIHAQAREALTGNASAKRLFEELSWIGPDHIPADDPIFTNN